METLREAVGAFDSPEQLEEAVNALTTSGWDRADLSMLGQEHLFSAELPREGRDSERAADDPAAPRGAIVSDADVRQGRTLLSGMAGVIAAFLASGAMIVTGGGALAAVVGAAAAGGGATMLVHALGRMAGASHDQFLHEQAARGGILLWVKLHKPEQEFPAQDILRRCGAKHVHIHEFRPEEGTRTASQRRRA
ncbi:MAG: hypothetical protein L6R19_25010 [Alphaproteobacteria bacterium]|nr:hypothetical protein [Alphaproteobacteria bacterium]